PGSTTPRAGAHATIRRASSTRRCEQEAIMSTFSGLGTAASALVAARRGMDVVGQNIANQTTEGYTRQRVSTSAIAAVAQVGGFSRGTLPGHGVTGQSLPAVDKTQEENPEHESYVNILC